MALINVYKLMIDTFSRMSSDNSDIAELKNPVTNTGFAPDSWGRRLMQYLTGGTLSEDFREDLESMNTGLQLFALDVGNAWRRMREGRISLISSPLMPSFVAVPAIVVSQPGPIAEIDCEAGVESNRIVLHPEGSYYCTDNSDKIQPVELTCGYIGGLGLSINRGEGGSQNDKTGTNCFENGVFYPFELPPEGMPNPAPLASESIPAPTSAVTSDTSDGNINNGNGEKKGFSLDDFSQHEERALAAAGLALVVVSGLLFGTLVHGLLPKREHSSGKSSVNYDPFDDIPQVKKEIIQHKSKWRKDKPLRSGPLIDRKTKRKLTKGLTNIANREGEIWRQIEEDKNNRNKS